MPGGTAPRAAGRSSSAPRPRTPRRTGRSRRRRSRRRPRARSSERRRSCARRAARRRRSTRRHGGTRRSARPRRAPGRRPDRSAATRGSLVEPPLIVGQPEHCGQAHALERDAREELGAARHILRGHQPLDVLGGDEAVLLDGREVDAVLLRELDRPPCRVRGPGRFGGRRFAAGPPPRRPARPRSRRRRRCGCPARPRPPARRGAAGTRPRATPARAAPSTSRPGRRAGPSTRARRRRRAIRRGEPTRCSRPRG